MRPPNPGLAVRPATEHDVEPLSRLLARAFRTDPFHRWIFPEEQAWARNSQRSFAAAIRWELEHRTVLTTADRRGVAIWRDPDLGPPTFWRQLQMAVPMIALLRCRSPRVLRGFQRLMALHPREPHWYLSVLGTDPEHQNKGIGSALVRSVLARCDGSGHAAYLEASRPENVPYYEHLGFEVVGEFPLPGGPPVWRMLRPPRGPSQANPTA